MCECVSYDDFDYLDSWDVAYDDGYALVEDWNKDEDDDA